MLNQKLIKNYSIALFKSALALDIQDKVFQQLQDISSIINNTQTLRKMLCSPIVQIMDKLRLIQVVVNKLEVEKILEEFLLLTIKHSRINMFDEILVRYKSLLDESKNIKNVKVTSSEVLNSDEQEEIKKYLEKDFKQKINVAFDYNARIIGGIIVQHDNKLIDYSIAGVLTRISSNAEVVISNK